MNFCPQCYAVLPDKATRCSQCHTRLEAPTYVAPPKPLPMGRLASPLRRAVAHCLDFIEPVLAFLIMFVIGLAGGVWLGLALLAIYIVRMLRDFARGKTPGKHLLGLQVVTVTGQPAGFVVMLLREWPGKMLSGLCGGLGFLWMLFDPHRQCWHDKLVSTYVVDVRGS